MKIPSPRSGKDFIVVRSSRLCIELKLDYERMLHFYRNWQLLKLTWPPRACYFR